MLTEGVLNNGPDDTTYRRDIHVAARDEEERALVLFKLPGPQEEPWEESSERASLCCCVNGEECCDSAGNRTQSLKSDLG